MTDRTALACRVACRGTAFGGAALRSAALRSAALRSALLLSFAATLAAAATVPQFQVDGRTYGMPEAQIILAHATIHAALAPKSNAVVLAIGAAMGDVDSGRIGVVPAHLRDGHYRGAAALGHGIGYVYPHDVPEGVAPQEYLPEALAQARYYRPTAHGQEERWRQVDTRLRELRAGAPPAPR